MDNKVLELPPIDFNQGFNSEGLPDKTSHVFQLKKGYSKLMISYIWIHEYQNALNEMTITINGKDPIYMGKYVLQNETMIRIEISQSFQFKSNNIELNIEATQPFKLRLYCQYHN